MQYINSNEPNKVSAQKMTDETLTVQKFWYAQFLMQLEFLFIFSACLNN